MDETSFVTSDIGAVESSVSVIIATKNSGRFLRECLESVRAQTLAPLEVILVDACSTDDTHKIAAEFPQVRIVKQRGTGFTGAWNEGIKAARGNLLAFLDSDDHWTPCKLEWQVTALKNTPTALGAVGKVRFFLSAGENPPSTMRPDILGKDWMTGMPGVLLARRELFERTGPWPEHLEITGDIDWFARLRDLGLPILEIPELLLHKRVHDQNLSYGAARKATYPRELMQVLHASITRKRAG
jgi:glycosyltransferase involved in cell wall biosynthesis